ncbi:MAG: DUF695 domain-containing protein [Aureispira sp.]|nr:DUF695 domain-containing protein [Aureispira sp.]
MTELYVEFWDWFKANESNFFQVVKENGDIAQDFFNKLSVELAKIKGGIYYLAGMYDDDTAELVFTADGVIKNIVFIEDLVAAAPTISGWKFTAHKPAVDISQVSLEVGGYQFSIDNLSFYSNTLPDYPDEIELTLVHSEYNEENDAVITNGIYLFLDNYLGELDFVTTIDNIFVVNEADAEQNLVPIEKLKAFLVWREKEFVEKYEGIRRNTGEDNYSALTAELKSGNPLIAIINTDLLNWDSKSSHPWILNIEIAYEGDSENGMPDEETYQILEDIEAKLIEELKDFQGYLNIGRQTVENVREIYFACKDFRKPSKVLFETQKAYADQFEITYDLYRDKYWRSLDQFNIN